MLPVSVGKCATYEGGSDILNSLSEKLQTISCFRPRKLFTSSYFYSWFLAKHHRILLHLRSDSIFHKLYDHISLERSIYYHICSKIFALEIREAGCNILNGIGCKRNKMCFTLCRGVTTSPDLIVCSSYGLNWVKRFRRKGARGKFPDFTWYHWIDYSAPHQNWPIGKHWRAVQFDYHESE